MGFVLTINPELAMRAFYYNAQEIKAGISFTDLFKVHNVLIPHFDFFYLLYRENKRSYGTSQYFISECIYMYMQRIIFKVNQLLHTAHTKPLHRA